MMNYIRKEVNTKFQAVLPTLALKISQSLINTQTEYIHVDVRPTMHKRFVTEQRNKWPNIVTV